MPIIRSFVRSSFLRSFLHSFLSSFLSSVAPCGSGSCRIDPLRFLARWRKRRLNQVLVSFGLVCVYVCSFYRLFRFFLS